MDTMLLPIIGGIIFVALIAVGAVFFMRSRKKEQLTADSIPPIPSANEANKHFTPIAPVQPVELKPSGVSKKTLITLAVVFNVILISSVIFIGQSMTKKQSITTYKTNAAPTTITLSPTVEPTQVVSSAPAALETPAASSESASVLPSPTSSDCTPPPPCVVANTCDIPVPTGGWCTTSPTPVSQTAKTVSPTSLLAQNADVASNPSMTVTLSPSPTDIIIQITATPTPTHALLPTPTEILVAHALATTPSITSTNEPTVLPTIPSAGSPISYLLIIVPALLVAIAFIL